MQLQPRSAAEVGRDFPYEMKTLCYIEIHKDGRVTHGTDQGTYQRAKSGDSTLYAVWPGDYSSHLFIIDDLDQYAGALGIIHDQERTGLADHDHDVNWQVSPYEKNPSGTYISVQVELLCGCKINNIKAFAEQMRKQKGWNVTTSTGWSGGGAIDGIRTYTVGIRRRSLESQLGFCCLRPASFSASLSLSAGPQGQRTLSPRSLEHFAQNSPVQPSGQWPAIDSAR